jgi:hypothetical protein
VIIVPGFAIIFVPNRDHDRSEPPITVPRIPRDNEGLFLFGNNGI